MEVVRATEAHLTEILALAERTLGWGPEQRWRDLYEWKHLHNAFGPSPAWVALVEGQLVGFRVFLRWRFTDGARRVHQAVRAVDTATDPAHQGRGIFTLLTTTALGELAAEDVRFVFNTPNDQSRPGYLKMGWIELGRPPIMTIPTSISGLWHQTHARTAAALWSDPSNEGDPAPLVLADPALDELVESLDRPDVLATDRTTDFLRWRYGFDALHYRAMCLGRDLRDGVALFRVRRRGSAQEATVTDLLVPASADAGRRRRRLLRMVRRSVSADYLLVGAERALLAAPAIPAPRLGPVLTWRSVVESHEPDLRTFRLGLGDLELF